MTLPANVSAFNPVLTARFLRSAQKMDASNDKRIDWLKVHTVSLVNLETGLIRTLDTNNRKLYYHLSSDVKALIVQSFNSPDVQYEVFAKSIVKDLKSITTHTQVPIQGAGLLATLPNLIQNRASFIENLWDRHNLMDVICHAEDLETPDPWVFSVCDDEYASIGSFVGEAIAQIQHYGYLVRTLQEMISDTSQMSSVERFRFKLLVIDEYEKNDDFGTYVLLNHLLQGGDDYNDAADALQDFTYNQLSEAAPEAA